MLIHACIFLFATLAPALDGPGVFVEDFTTGNQEAEWLIPIGPGQSVVVPGTSDSPRHLVNPNQCCGITPTVVTTKASSVFTGNYRQLGVLSLGLDMIVTLAQANPHPDFSVTLMLVHDNGTPGDTSDDTRVYLNLGESIPWPGEGWKSYDFPIPSHLDLPFGELPAGWQFYDEGFGGGPWLNHTWREVMENVSQVWFIGFADPAGIGFLLNWKVGVDNLRLVHRARLPVGG